MTPASTIKATETEDGPNLLSEEDLRSHAERRTRRVLLSGASSSIARVIQMSTLFISVPFAIRYLGTERFGLWMTINSVLAIASFADFGLGNGLLNVVASAYGKGDFDAIKRAISSSVLVLFAISGLFSAAFWACFRYIHWAHVFNTHSRTAGQEAGPAVAVFFCCFAVSLPFGIVQRLQLAYQEGFLNGIWSAAGSILGLVGLFLAIHMKLGLPWLVAAVAGMPALMLVLNSLVLLIKRPYLRPSWSSYSWHMSEHILKMGGLFFVLQVAMTIGSQTDNLVISRILGPEYVTQYAVPLKLFQCVPIFAGFFMQALWPAYGEAASRKDAGWIRNAYRKSLAVNLAIAIPAALFLMLTARTIVHYWIGDTVRPSTLLLVGLGSYCATYTLIGPISALMNGLSVLKFQAVSWSLMAIANLLLSIFLTRSIGISGVVFGTVVAQILFIIVPSLLHIPSCLRKIETGAEGPAAG